MRGCFASKMHGLNTKLPAKSVCINWKRSQSLVSPSACCFQPNSCSSRIILSNHSKASRRNGQHCTRTQAEAPSSSPSAATSSGIVNYKEAELVPTRGESAGPFPDQPGVYGMYSGDKKLQYIGLSRKISQTIEHYCKELPDLTHFIKFTVSPSASREQMIEVWKAWLQEAYNENGGIPPGNDRNNQTWTQKRKVKPEIKLTPGKGIEDLTVPMKTLVDQVVKSCKVVAFVKGTRTQPQCGFSYKVLSMLNEIGADYEVLNVLDEIHNPTLREVIKEYSEWPTIPQLYIKGEFVGGADILEEMHNKGELKELLLS